jgi:ribosomal protein S18 acetylase RimI-like enzyme
MEKVSTRGYMQRINELLKELSPSSPEASLQSIGHFFEQGGHMVVVTGGDNVVALATLVTITKVNGVTGRIEHVVVANEHRGKGLSYEMMLDLIAIAQKQKLRYLDLTTEPKRIEANGLYQKLGFVKRDTNPYRLKLT